MSTVLDGKVLVLPNLILVTNSQTLLLRERRVFTARSSSVSLTVVVDRDRAASDKSVSSAGIRVVCCGGIAILVRGVLLVSAQTLCCSQHTARGRRLDYALCAQMLYALKESETKEMAVVLVKDLLRRVHI